MKTARTKATPRPTTGANQAAEASVDLQMLPVDAIATGARNPRRKLSGVGELAASMRTYGLLQPVVARRKANAYELVAGHRRLAAARELGWPAIPAIVRDEAEDGAYLLTLVENLQRQDLSPREEAAALEVLLREHAWSTRQVAAAIHRSQPYVSKRLRVFEDAMLGPAVLANQVSVSVAEELLAAPPRHRYDLLSRAVEERWDLAQARAAVRQQRFGPNRAGGPRKRGLAQRLSGLRMELRDVDLADLNDVERRQLRLLFAEMAMLARSQPQQQIVFPPLPRTS